MQPRSILLPACIAAVAAAGCIYEEQCETVDYAGDAVQYFDPVSGDCAFIGGGGECWDERAVTAAPDQGVCWTACNDLGETACFETAGCRALYVSDCVEGEPCRNSGVRDFATCIAIAPSGPAPVTEACSGLDAYSCSRRQDCAAAHRLDAACGLDAPCDPLARLGEFESCFAEPEIEPTGCYGDQECGPGYECNADEVCLPPPGCDDGEACPAVCYGYCVPEDAAGCYGEVQCEAEPPACPAGTVAARENGCWTGDCIAFGNCEPPLDPGLCYAEAQCDSLPPACPAGSLPGVVDGCWSGHCIPEGQCTDVPLSCKELAVESTCIARDDCEAYYVGIGCSCDPSGCGCDEWVFDECRETP